jgi:hypothetical protein
MSRWPKDNQSDLIRFYGTPGPEVEAQLVSVTPPFRMTYEGKPIKSIRFHKKAAFALAAALNEIWDHYGHDQKKIDALGISKYAGAYNPRFIRGSTTKWSNHAYGAAIDLNAEDNGFGKGKGTIPQPVIDAFKRQGARWGGDYRGRTDPMHFEFCDNGLPDAKPIARPVALMDAPQVDNDRDEPAPPPQPEPVAVKPNPPLADDERVPFFKRWWRTITGYGAGGGVGLSALGYMTDWRVVATLFGATTLLLILFVLLMGPVNVRNFIRRQINKG